MSEAKLLLLSAAVAAAVFAFDLLVPLGVAAGVPYVALVLLGMWARKTRNIFILAAIGSILTVVGYLFSATGVVAWVVLTNRGLAFAVIWTTAMLVAHRKRAQDALKQAHDELEDRVQRRTAELRKNETQLRLITNNLPVLIAQCDKDLRVLFANSVCEQWYARPSDQIIGFPIEEILGAEAMAHLRPHIKVVLDGNTATFETKFTFPDGINRDVEVTYIPQLEGNGTVNAFFALAIDITERRITDEFLRQTQKLEAVGQLTGGVAHDFNNLLTAIIGNLGMIEDRGIADERNKESIAIAQRAALRGAELTQSLLAFSRQQPLDAKKIRVNDMLPQFQEMTRRTIGTDIAIEMKLAAEPWTTMVDAGQLENALLNLVLNARDAMPNGGQVTIETANQYLEDEGSAISEELLPGPYVTITISDSGTGMPKEVQERAFEPFFTTKEIGQGSGLGLSMVFGFAKQSGGHVSIDSEEGTGTTVRIYLPRAEETANLETTAIEPEDDKPSGEETILVVEDDRDVRDYLVTLLDHLNYTVLEAEDGSSALHVMRTSGPIDLLLTDIILPGEMNGRDIAKAFRERHPAAGVLYSTGHSGEILSHHGRLEEGVSLISKPYKPSALAQRVRELLDDRG